MLKAYVALSYLLYALPVVFVVVGRSHKNRSLAEFSLDIPSALAADLILILVLSRVTTLGNAVFASRWIWLGGFTAHLGFRWRKKWPLPQWPQVLNRRVAAQVLVGFATGGLLSILLSRTLGLWDREWHIPLVSSLRGQRLPFLNVYTPDEGLYYHFAGNVIAAALQVLTMARAHASLAISMSHDVAFASIGVFLALFWRHLGLRAWALTALAIAAVLFTGPLAMFFDFYHNEHGYSFPSFASWGLRPHMPFSALFTLQFAATVLLRLMPAPDGNAVVGHTSMRISLALATAALTLTDETSLGLVALASGIVWLFSPQVFGDNRRSGLITIGILVAVIAASAFALVGAIGPGAIRYPVQFVAPRSPGFYVPSLSLSSWDGCKRMLQDCAVMLATLVGLWRMAIASRQRPYVKLAAFGTAVFVLGVGLLASWDHNGSGLESHRFAFAPMLLLPFVFITAAAGVLNGPQLGRILSLPAVVLAAFFILVPVVTSLEWAGSGVAAAQSDSSKGFVAADNFYDLDCVASAGARLQERARLTLVDSQSFFHYSGCRPIFALGPLVGIDNQILKIGWPRLNRDALTALQEKLPADERLRVVCSKAPSPSDFVCERAKAQLRCPSTSRDFHTCQANGEQRTRMLAF